MRADSLIVGVGNSLAGDDGVGARAVELLAQVGLPPSVRLCVVDGDLLGVGTVWEGEPYLLILDAVVGGGAPGSVYWISEGELLHYRSLGVHGLCFAELLGLVRLILPGGGPKVVEVAGVEPERLSPCGQMSGPVAKGVELLVKMVRRRFARGICPEQLESANSN